MANPQAENGHIDIANEIADHFCHYRISGEEWLVLWAILRKTYGWKKKEDKIALSQLSAMTGLKRQTVLRAIKKLESKKVIDVIKNNDTQINTYRFVKDFEQWEPLSKKITVSTKKDTVIKKDNEVSSKKITTVSQNDYKLYPFLRHTKENKETITKETITKEKIHIVEQVISYLNEQTGKTFSPKTKSTIAHINARLSEGRTFDDFKRVIENKCKDWLNDPHMSRYLRPETLFGTKFEGYLNEIQHPLAGQVSDITLRNISVLENWRPPTT